MKPTLIAAVLILMAFSCSSFALDTKADLTILKQIIAEDKTDEIEYKLPLFTCHQFAKMLFLRRSTLVSSMDQYNLPQLEKDWEQKVERKEKTKKLPIYLLHLSNVSNGFYHTVNAVLVNEASPNELSSYVFVLPETDDIITDVDGIYKRYLKYLAVPNTDKTLNILVALFQSYEFNSPHGTAQYKSVDKIILSEDYLP